MSTAANDVEKGNLAASNAFEHSAMDASIARQRAIQVGALRTIANPAPLGLFSFASTTLILSLYNVQARHILIPNVVVGMAVGVGGLAQLLAGQWEFVCGNTFGATAFTSYGAFWLSFALIYWPGSGILAAYTDATDQLTSALGIYLITWFIVTFIFFIASLKTHAAFNALFGFLTITFMLLAIGMFLGNLKATKAGGAFGIVTAFVAYYTGCTILFTKQDAFVNLPRGQYRRID